MKSVLTSRETQMGWYEVLQNLEKIKLELKKKRDTCLNPAVAAEIQKEIEALQNAMAIVSREIPEPPANMYMFNNVAYGVCPNPYCNHTGIRHRFEERCSRCGKKIDWDFDVPMSKPEFEKKIRLNKKEKPDNE